MLILLYFVVVSHGLTTIFSAGIIAFNVSVHKYIGSHVVAIDKLFLTPPSKLEVVKCLLNFPQC